MAVQGTTCITAVLEHLKPEDVQILLANRGLPSVGTREELTESLQVSTPLGPEILPVGLQSGGLNHRREACQRTGQTAQDACPKLLFGRTLRLKVTAENLPAITLLPGPHSALQS